MSQVRIGQVDLATGEILEGATLAVFFPKRKNGFVRGWIAMAQDPLLKLAQADLGDQARRVFFALLANLDFENELGINQAALGRLLGMHASNISRALARLVKEGVIERVGEYRGGPTFVLNPSYGWKGSAKNHHEALKRRMKARGLSVVDGGRQGSQEALGGAIDEGVDVHTLDLFSQA